MKKLLIVLVMLLLPQIAWATTYYVCNTEADCDAGVAGNTDWETGNDVNNGTARGTPWLTIDYAASQVSAGDTVIVGDGDYNDYRTCLGYGRVSICMSDKQGTDDPADGEYDSNWITIQTENPYGAHINMGGNSLSGNDRPKAFIMRNGTAYVKLKGFEVSQGVAVASTGNEIAHHIIVEDFYIHDIHTPLPRSCDAAPGAFFTNIYCYNWTIDRCKIHTLTTEFQSGCGDYPNWDHNYGHGHAIYLEGKYHTVQNCILWDIQTGWAIKLDGHRAPYATGYSHTIINNTFHGDANPIVSGIIQFWNNDSDGDWQDASAYIGNNAFYQPGNNNPYAIDTAIWNAQSNCSLEQNCALKINLADTTIEYNVTNSQYIIRPCTATAITGAGGTVSNNTTLNDYNDTLGLVDPDNNSYVLTSGAENLVDSAIATYAPSLDFLQTVRPQGAGYDVGAYEFIGSSSTVTPSVATNDADGLKTETGGEWYSNAAANTLSVGYVGLPQHNSTHLRFQLNVPQGATILTAKVTLTAYQSRSDGAIADVYAEDVDNSEEISSVTEYNTAVGQLTTASVEWDWPVTTAESEYESPNLATVVQEVVNRSGWSSNNYIQFFLVDTASTTNFRFYDYENGSKYAQLSVTYGEASATFWRWCTVPITQSTKILGQTGMGKVLEFELTQ